MSAARRAARLALGLAVAAALAAAALEVGTRALVGGGLLDAPRPSGGDTGVWWGDHPVFGVWHRPGTSGEVASACFRVSYRINRAGARDAERPLRAAEPRAVVLGDSFLEGWGVAEADRLPNLLEAASGVPHLNFAMAHFGPYQELLVYRELAQRWDHTAVLASVLPVNDFADIDLETARRMTGYEYRYRPYLVGEPPDLVHLDYREPAGQRWLRQHSYAFEALRHALAVRRADPTALASAPDHSFFYDASPRQWALLDAVLERLSAAAAGKNVAWLLIPSERDLARYAADGPAPLSGHLAERARALGARLVDLLPAMARHSTVWSAYYHSCDYHWSRYGHRVAAEIVGRELGPDFYGIGAGAAAEAAPPRAR